MNLYKKINGWCRLFIWGYCPECNGDSPKYFDCEVCNCFHLGNRYSHPTKKQRFTWWGKFLEYNSHDKKN